MSKKTYVAAQGGSRLDQYLAQEKICTSRSEAARLIREERVLIEGRKTKPSAPIFSGDRIKIDWPPLKPTELTPKKIDFDILYEDDDILVLNKPAGLVVHPGAGNYDESLVHGLLFHCQNLSGIGGVERPGIVHRLDKGTSGVMVVAKNDKSHQHLSQQFQNKKIKKEYAALCLGEITKDAQTVKTLITRAKMNRKKFVVNQKKGKSAVTHLAVLKKNKKASYVLARIETGRTHQIRVHLSHLGHPVMGDGTYGGTKRIKNFDENDKKYVRGLSRPLLHSETLIFEHPRTKKTLTFFCEIPDDFKKALNYFLG